MHLFFYFPAPPHTPTVSLPNVVYCHLPTFSHSNLSPIYFLLTKGSRVFVLVLCHMQCKQNWNHFLFLFNHLTLSLLSILSFIFFFLHIHQNVYKGLWSHLILIFSFVLEKSNSFLNQNILFHFFSSFSLFNSLYSIFWF